MLVNTPGSFLMGQADPTTVLPARVIIYIERKKTGDLPWVDADAWGRVAGVEEFSKNNEERK